MIILVSNIVGLLPFSYAVTGSIAFTMFFAAQCYIGAFFIGVLYRRFKILGILLPKGVPLLIAPFFF